MSLVSYTADTAQSPTATQAEYPIETMRGIAVLTLVSFHVIGGSHTTGLALDYPSPYRMFADFLVDVRMPLFAFIAGYVYGLRPVTPKSYGKFLTGKWHRLAVPGIVATIIFAALSTAIGTVFAVTPGEIWEIFLFPYAHFWFLQAILLIFLIFGFFDAWLGNRFVLVFLALSCLAFLQPKLPNNVFSVNSAVLLAPFFLLGLAMIRLASQVQTYRLVLVALSAVGILLGSWEHLDDLRQLGEFSRNRRDVHSLYYGLSICAFLALTLPKIRMLEWIGPYSFTIYLYHVLATSATRRVLDKLGMEQDLTNYVLGLLAGILGPVLLHMLAMQTPIARRYVLGLRR